MIKKEPDFNYISLIVPNLMLNLRNVWTSSSYFSIDRNMEHLLHEFSTIFTMKIKQIIALKYIFNLSTIEAFNLATQCSQFLRNWREIYLSARQDIENMKTEKRWEFDQKYLFDEVDHYACVSCDLANVLKEIIEIENLLQNRVKFIARNPEDVTSILQKVSFFFWYERKIPCSQRNKIFLFRFTEQQTP